MSDRQSAEYLEGARRNSPEFLIHIPYPVYKNSRDIAGGNPRRTSSVYDLLGVGALSPQTYSYKA